MGLARSFKVLLPVSVLICLGTACVVAPQPTQPLQPTDPFPTPLSQLRTPTIEPAPLPPATSPEQIDPVTPTVEPTPRPNLPSYPLPSISPAAPRTAPQTPFALPDSRITVQNSNQLVELARWGNGVIHQANYLRDGRRLLVATSTGIYLYDALNWETLLYIPTSGPIQKAILLEDHHLLIAQVAGFAIYWSFPDGELLHKIKCSHRCEFSSDGQFLADYESNDQTSGVLSVWHILEEKPLHQLKGERLLGFSPDSKTFLTVGDNDKVKVWDLARGRLLQAIPDPSYNAIFSKNGAAIILATKLGASEWRVSDGAKIGEYMIQEGEPCYIPEMYLSPNEMNLAFTCEEADRVYIWDVINHTYVGTLDTNLLRVGPVAFSDNGLTLAVGDGAYGGEIQVWDLTNLRQLWNGENHFYRIKLLDFSPNGSNLISVGYESSLQRWAVESGQLLGIHPGHTAGEVRSVDFTPDNEYLAAISAFNVEAWNVRLADRQSISPKQFQTQMSGRGGPEFSPAMLSGPTGEFYQGTLSPDGQMLALTDYIFIHLMDFPAGTNLKKLEGFPHQLVFSPSGEFLANVGHGLSIQSVADGAELWRIEDKWLYTSSPLSRIAWLTFFPDGKFLAMADDHCDVQIRSAMNGDRIHLLPSRWGWEPTTCDLNFLTFTPSGEFLIWSSYLNIEVYRVVDWELVMHLPGIDNSYITSQAISSDGEILVVGFYNGVIGLYRMDQGDLIRVLVGHTDEVADIKFSPNGRLIASGSLDGTVRIWGIP